MTCDGKSKTSLILCLMCGNTPLHKEWLCPLSQFQSVTAEKSNWVVNTFFQLFTGTNTRTCFLFYLTFYIFWKENLWHKIKNQFQHKILKCKWFQKISDWKSTHLLWLESTQRLEETKPERTWSCWSLIHSVRRNEGNEVRKRNSANKYVSHLTAGWGQNNHVLVVEINQSFKKQNEIKTSL